MRQFVSPRFWLAIAALVGLTYGLWYVLVRKDETVAVVGKPSTEVSVVHRVNIIHPVYAIQAEAGFSVANGVATGEMHLALDATRTMVIKKGTPGEISCSKLAEINQCVVAADLLGDAVVWFSLVPNQPRASLILPGVTQVRAENWVLLANGWEVARNEVVERNCDAAGLTDFVRQFGGDKSTATFSYEQQQIVKVTCLNEPDNPTTTSTPPTTLLPQPQGPIDTSVLVDEEGNPIESVPTETVAADVIVDESVPVDTGG
jgi:hypothetical protein